MLSRLTERSIAMISDDRLNELCDLFNQVVNQYGKFEKEVHAFGVDIPLHLSDTHTIVAIGKHTNINIVNLSRLQGISRSAASQMVSKLVKRGFVKKEVSPKTDNEIVLTLTETGKNVYYAHEKQHQQLKAKLTEIFEKYPAGTLDTLMQIGTDLKNIWEAASK
jgi:Transcriptional regulators